VILPDVNVLVYAFRVESRDHERYRGWLQGLANGEEAYALASMVLSSFIRVVTNRRIFRPPSPLELALEFTERLLMTPQCVPVRPGARHWGIFTRLCRQSGATGNLVPAAFLAALALEHGCELVTNDADFARFKGLRWRHPLT
jgi:uncharacterized protein